jgi:hypothetical protein
MPKHFLNNFASMQKSLSLLHLFLLIAVSFVFVHSVEAQRKIKDMDSDKQEKKDEVENDNKKSFWDKTQFGGTFFGGLSNLGGYVLLQPQMFHHINDHFTAGGGVTYIYIKRTLSSGSNSLSISDNLYGPNLFLRYNIVQGIFAHTEYAAMNFTSYNLLGEKQRVWGNSLYLGGGFMQSMGSGTGGAYIMILYDVLWKDDFTSTATPASFSRTFRPSPWDFRIGFMF